MGKVEIKQEESNFYTQYSLVEKVEDRDVVDTINYLLAQVIKEKQLDEKLILEMRTYYNRETQKIYVDIDYYKFNPEELKSMPVNEQIRTVLLKMGYSEDNILGIEYKKFWENSNKKVWVAKVYDADYNEALKESDICTTREISEILKNTAKKILGFKLYFEFF